LEEKKHREQKTVKDLIKEQVSGEGPSRGLFKGKFEKRRSYPLKKVHQRRS